MGILSLCGHFGVRCSSPLWIERSRRATQIQSGEEHRTPKLNRWLAHVAVLIFLAAAAGAGIVAADALAAVADRLGLLVSLLAAGDGLVLLTADTLAVGDRSGARRRFMHRGPDLPERFLKTLIFLHAQDRVG